MKVVIADDEEIILKWMKKNIEALFPECQVVATCTNGKQALECCKKWVPDLLFTDIRMPVMDGMELVEQLQDEEKFPYTVILSAYDDFSYAREAMKLGTLQLYSESREKSEKYGKLEKRETTGGNKAFFLRNRKRKPLEYTRTTIGVETFVGRREVYHSHVKK